MNKFSEYLGKHGRFVVDILMLLLLLGIIALPISSVGLLSFKEEATQEDPRNVLSHQDTRIEESSETTEATKSF
jgi:hypothetical protein